jgi:SAM-dependent methyltransferase
MPLLKADHDDSDLAALADAVLRQVRTEFTVMPRFGYHQPLDYEALTLPPVYEAETADGSTDLPVPPPRFRFGYSPDDTAHYLVWGRYDHDELRAVLTSHAETTAGLSILDLGCSSGRVLRHFQHEWRTENWKLHGCDIQALAIQWLRDCFPRHFTVVTTTTLPHLPFPDASFDFIYGISVFTHIKYLWDAWLLELRRVLKPGGLLVQTIHAERAWEFYARHRAEAWVRDSQPPRVYETARMDVDFLQFGDMSVSQVFWRRDVAARYWGRYFDVLELRDPPSYSFQDWIICRKDRGA